MIKGTVVSWESDNDQLTAIITMACCVVSYVGIEGNDMDCDKYFGMMM